MPHRASYHHGDLSRTILDIAMQMLQEKGGAGISIRAVATKADVSQTAIYHHFKNKNELLAAVAEVGFRQLCEEQEALADFYPDPDVAMQKLGEHYVEFSVKNPHLFILMYGALLPFSDWTDSLRKQVTRAFHPLLTVSNNRVNKHQLHHTSDEMALAAWAIVHGLSSLIINQRLGPLGNRVAENDGKLGVTDYVKIAHKMTKLFAAIVDGLPKGSDGPSSPS